MKKIIYKFRLSNFGDRFDRTYFLIRARLFPKWALHKCCFEIPTSLSHIYESYCDCCINNCLKCQEND